MFSFLKDLDQTVHEGRYPEEPFQNGRKHDEAHDGRVYNLPAGGRLVPLLSHVPSWTVAPGSWTV